MGYSRDYTEKPLPRAFKAIVDKENSRPRLPFSGESSSHAAYQAPPTDALLAARVSPAPGPRHSARSVPFEGKTSYNSEFVRKEVPVCPVTRMPPRPPSAPPGREHTFWDKSE